jgi:acyl-CoA reductase-like NAD-dependent aldehyde dehydrogenase
VPRIRRPGPIGLALTAFEVWRRLPPEQRRQLMDATRKQAPRAAAAALAYWRSRPPRR